jgi:rhamnopyranosyl-N-acetylglucosaminyl-diphospho-decaprenol beta-1,3/1,4-galactofuranosyltransferase
MAEALTAEATIAVVIPTLNRLADLEACLDGVAEQTRPADSVLVVDNGSTDGTRERLQDRSGVRPLLMDRNTGAPGGFQAGMDAAFAAGADWVWLLDDDAVPEPAALEHLLAAVDAYDGTIGGAVPTVEFGDGRRETGWLWGARAADGHSQSPNTPANGTTPEADVDWGPFAGLLLTRSACERVGVIRADYVLWHADVEYCLRIRAAGYRIVAAPNALVRHPAMPMISRRIAGRTVTVGRIQPWREYYDTRNARLLARTLRNTDFAQRTPLPARAWREFKRGIAVLIADPAGPRRLLMRARGALDGVRGKVDRRPELEDSAHASRHHGERSR